MKTTRRNINRKSAALLLILLLSLLPIVSCNSKQQSSEFPQKIEGALRPGSPEFDQYRQKIPLDKPEATEAARAIGDIVMTLKTTVRNFSGRTINGLEIYAAVVDSQGKPVKERTVVAVPSRRTGQMELEHNQVLEVPVMLEGMRKEDDRANIKMEVTAIRFK